MTMFRARKCLGLTQAQLGEAVGVSQVTICHLERGRSVSAGVIDRVAEVLDLPREALISDDAIQPEPKREPILSEEERKKFLPLRTLTPEERRAWDALFDFPDDPQDAFVLPDGIKGVPTLATKIEAAGIRPPDVVFDLTLLDPQVREDNGLEIPEAIRERMVNCEQQFKPGVYLIFNGADEEPWYAGKAARVQNRLHGHLVGRGSDVLERAADDRPFDFCPFAAVWRCDAAPKAGLEIELIHALDPRYNKNERRKSA